MKKHRSMAWALAAGLAIGFGFVSIARAKDEGHDPTDAPPPVPASDQGELAMRKFKLPAGFKCDLFASEPVVANPVAICSDERGRLYVVETFRLHYGTLDIRSYEDWYEQDLASRSVDDRLKLMRAKTGPNFKRIFTSNSDKIVLLEDSSGSGKADKSTVYAEGFNQPLDGLGASVLERKGTVYFAEIPNLWMLKDTTGTGKADFRKSLSYGYGVRFSYTGHDLHGLRFGPDGKLYFSIGDRGADVTQSVDGRTIDNPETGGIFRCNADGTGLELFATGLRNPQQLVFDDRGNLFTGDNNPDYGDPARWVYLVEGGDSGWRQAFQHATFPNTGGPWETEELWQAGSKLKAASELPPAGFVGMGPSGVAYYPGTGLNDSYAQHFFMCEFHGGAVGSGILTFTCQPQGAGFSVPSVDKYIWDCLATDICFAPGGGTYVSDWVEGWDAIGKGRIYHIYDPAGMTDPATLEVKKLMAEGMESRSLDELKKLLAHRDQRIRQEAQFELADRGPASLATFTAVANQDANQLARLHAIWGLGQIAGKTPDALGPVIALLSDPDPEVRAQAAHVAGEGHAVAAKQELLRLLSDSSLRVRFFAAMGLGKIGQADAAPAIVNAIRENDNKDPWLRHACVMALTWLKNEPVIAQAAKDSSPAVRLASLLTLRRLHSADVAQFVNDADSQIVLEAARAINDTFIEPARLALATLIAKDGLSDPVEYRVLNANFRLGAAENARALAGLAARATAPERGRVEALKMLGKWASPGGTDYVMHMWRPLPDRDVAVAREALTPVLGKILHSAPDSVKVEAVKLIEPLGIADNQIAVDVVQDATLSPDLRRAALGVLADRNDPHLAEAVKLCLADKQTSLRVAAIRATAGLPDAASQLRALVSSDSIQEAQAAYGALARVSGDVPDQILLKALDDLVAGRLKPALQLDVLEACSRRTNPQIKRALARFEGARSKTDSLAAYRECLQGGNAEKGDRIFHERADVACIRCHTVHNNGGIVGPKLDGVGSRQNRDYLMESIVYPNAKIATGYESAVVKTHDGKAYVGIVHQDGPSTLQLIDNDGKTIDIKKDDIASRQRGLSPMPEGLMKTLSKSDLRDLVEFLAELK